MSLWTDLIGTTRSFFRIGFTGPRLKQSGTNLLVRNSADTADADATVATLRNSSDSLEINSDAADAGADRKLTLRKNPAATAALVVDFPPAKGTDGYVLRQKPGTAADVLELELVPPTSGGMSLLVDTTSLGFGSTSPVTMFELSETAVIDKIQVAIDVTFDGTPSLSVGIAGQVSKYASATDIDLTATAPVVFEVHPGLPAPGAIEDLIATYAAGGATVGSARIIVYYADAPA